MPAKLIVTLTVISFLMFSVPQTLLSEVIDKIIVIVNDEIITQGELDRILTPIYWQYKNLYGAPELSQKMDEARRNIIQKMIQDRLLLTEARKKGLEVDEKEIKAKLDEARKRFATSDDFKNALAQENLLESDLENRFRERLLIDKVVEMEIRKRVSVSPIEILNFYRSNVNMFVEAGKIRLRSMLIKVTEERNEERALRFAKIILRRLKEGGDFALLAQRYSDGPYSESGGDMGWVREGELMKKINDLVFGMDEGEISGVLKTDLGFHIFRLEEKSPLRKREFHEVKKEIEKIIFGQKTEKNLSEWIKRLKEDAYIAFR